MNRPNMLTVSLIVGVSITKDNNVRINAAIFCCARSERSVQALNLSEIDTYTDKYLLVVALVKYAVTGKFLVLSVKFSIKFPKSK